MPRGESVQSLVLLAMGVVIYIITRSPVVGVIVASIHAAAHPLAAAWWLVRTDSSRSRAVVCSLFYAAAACWQVAAHAFVSLMLIMLTAEVMQMKPEVEEFAPTLLALLSGTVLTTFVGLAAIAAALRSGVRAWVRPNLRHEHQSNIAMLRVSTGPYRFNYAIFIVATSLMFPVIGLASVMLIVFLAVVQPANMLGAVLGLAMLLLGPFAMIAVYAWLSPRIIARTPADCWSESHPIAESLPRS